MTESSLNQPALPVSNQSDLALAAGMSVPIAMRQIIRSQVNILEENLPIAFRGEDIEGVHKIRVSLQRLRSCLRIARPFYRKKKMAATWIDLKFVRQVFGRVRDMDVFREKFNTYYAGLGSGQNFIEEIWLPVFDLIYQDYTSQINARATLEIIDLLLKTLGEFQISYSVLKSPRKQAALPGNVGSYLPDILASQLEEIQNFNFEEKDRNYPRHHQLRLLAKAHRYTCEFFKSVLNPIPAASYIEHLILLQDYLGELNDTVQAIHFLSTHQSPRLSITASETLKAYIEIQRERQKYLATNFPAIWQEFQANKPRSLLADAISPL